MRLEGRLVGDVMSNRMGAHNVVVMAPVAVVGALGELVSAADEDGTWGKTTPSLGALSIVNSNDEVARPQRARRVSIARAT